MGSGREGGREGFRHIANPHIRERLRKKIIDSGYRMPVMCSPEELLNEDDDI